MRLHELRQSLSFFRVPSAAANPGICEHFMQSLAVADMRTLGQVITSQRISLVFVPAGKSTTGVLPAKEGRHIRENVEGALGYVDFEAVNGLESVDHEVPALEKGGLHLGGQGAASVHGVLSGFLGDAAGAARELALQLGAGEIGRAHV